MLDCASILKNAPKAPWGGHIIEVRSGYKICIIIRSNFPPIFYLEKIKENSGFSQSIDELWLVSPMTFKEKIDEARYVFMGSSVHFHHVEPGDLNIKLQKLVSAIDEAQKLIEFDLCSHHDGDNISDHIKYEVEREVKYSVLGAMLSRHFSPHIIKSLDGHTTSEIKDKLHSGRKVRGVSVLMTDIVNFSSMVNAIEEEAVNDFMANFYRASRDIIFKYNGVLDKFIGDAALAYFGYPYAEPDSALNALRCGAEICAMTDILLRNLQKNTNISIVPGVEYCDSGATSNDGRIYSGTRAGISTGSVYVIDTSVCDSDVGISFIGDTINISQRLQSKAKINHVQIDNTTMSAVTETKSGHLIHFAKADFDNLKGQSRATIFHETSFGHICEAFT